MTLPKDALEEIVKAGSREPFLSEIKAGATGPILNTHAKIAKAAIPVAELHEEIVQWMLMLLETDVSWSENIEKAKVFKKKLEALKCTPQK